MQTTIASTHDYSELLLYTMPMDDLRQILIDKSTELLAALPNRKTNPQKVARLNATVNELQRILNERKLQA